VQTPNRHFYCQQSTKKATGKSALYVLWYICQKAPLGPKQCQKVKKNQTIVELNWSEGTCDGISQAGS